MAAKTVTLGLVGDYDLTRSENAVSFEVSYDKTGKLGELLVSKGSVYWVKAGAKTKANDKRNAKRLAWDKLAELFETHGKDGEVR
jgi:hypothetical protein